MPIRSNRVASRVSLAASIALLLSACGTQQAVQKSEQSNQAYQERTTKALDRLTHTVKSGEPDYHVARPFVSGKPQPLAREVTLPRSLRKGVRAEVVFRGAARVDLATAANTLSLALSVPIRVRPDALMPQSAFAPRTGAAATPAATPGAAVAAASPSGLPQVDASGNMVNLQVGEMDGAAILDHICSQTGNYWRYDEASSAVEIYRLVTRTFEVHAQQGRVSVATGLGRAGSQGGSFDASSQTKVEQTGLDSIQEVKTAVEGMLSRGGMVIVGNGTLVVTDTKDSVDRVAAYIESENRTLTRRVRLVFEAIEVSSRDSNEAGLNWDLVYQRLSRLASGAGIVEENVGQRSPTSLVTETAGRTSFTLNGSSQFSGSQLMLRALSDVGTVTNHTRVPMMTLNRRPVQYAVRTNFDYVKSIQVSTVASSGGTTTAPAVTQSEETVGTVLTVTPSAFGNGKILLNLAYDNTILRSLEPYSAGGGSAGSTLSTVQQKTVDGSGTVQSVSIRSGQTLVISGIEKIANQFDQRRLDKNVPMIFGGSDRARSTRSTTVLLVTAVAEDGI